MVAVPPKYEMPKTEKFVVDAPPFNEARLVTARVEERVAACEAPRVVKEAAPAVRASTPMLIAPKFPVMDPESRAPTVVREEDRIPPPKALAVKTSVPAIW